MMESRIVAKKADHQTATEYVEVTLPVTLHGRHVEDLAYNYGCGGAFLLTAVACFIFVLLKRTDVLAGWSFGIMLLAGSFGVYLMQAGYTDYWQSRFNIRLSEGGIKLSRIGSVLVLAWDEIQRMVMRSERSAKKAIGNPTLSYNPAHFGHNPMPVYHEVEISGSPGCFRFNAVHLPDFTILLAVSSTLTNCRWELPEDTQIPSWHNH